MNPKTRSLRAAPVLAVLTGMLAALFAMTAPAAQAEPAARYDDGFLQDKGQLLDHWRAGATATAPQVLHVDTAHEADDVFWFAIDAVNEDPRGPGLRDIRWVSMSKRAWCTSPVQRMGFNAWRNVTECLVVDQLAEQVAPGWTAKHDQCRRDVAPWATPADGSLATCSPYYLVDTHSVTTLDGATTNQACAPWEDNSFVSDARYLGGGYPACQAQRYDWEVNRSADAQAAYPFLVDMDACTQMPAGSNREAPYVDPRHHVTVPYAGSGSCDGSDPGPNCASGDAQRFFGCGRPGGFIPLAEAKLSSPTTPTAPAPGGQTAGFTGVSTQTGSASVTRSVVVSKSAQVEVVNRTVKKTVRKRVDGRLFSASAKVPLRLSRPGSAAVPVSGSSTLSVTATRTCRAATQVDADTCARLAATTEATRSAQAQASAEALFRAQTAAAAPAQQAAVLEAARSVSVAAGKAATPTSAEISEARAAAVKKARKVLLRKISRAS